MLAEENPTSLERIAKIYDNSTKSIMSSWLGWNPLCELFKGTLSDLGRARVYLMIDALDECESELQNLLRLVVNGTKHLKHVKWIVSSRDVPSVFKEVRTSIGAVTTLELSTSLMSSAVDAFITYKVSVLQKRNGYNHQLRDEVRKYLSDHAESTFLWVALACQEIYDLDPVDEPLEKLKEIPSGLGPLYDRMMKQIGTYSERNREYCQKILSTISLAFRPMNLQELMTTAGLPSQSIPSSRSMKDMVDKCGSFLVIRNSVVQFIHQSAKDYIVNQPDNQSPDSFYTFSIYPSGKMAEHCRIFTKSLQTMTESLHRDMLDLRDPGILVSKLDASNPKPLQHIKYACNYWVFHLSELDKPLQHRSGLKDGGLVHVFLETHILHWLEVMSLIEKVHVSLASISLLILLASKVSEPASSFVFPFKFTSNNSNKG